MIVSWLIDIVRTIFFAIDGIIYKFIDTVYSLFLEIANTSIFTEKMIDEFAGKVYALVGIFMLFKVSFSLLTYIINPDEFADKSKGMGKLVKNIITSLMLFILVPIIFREAMDLQRIILKDDIIPRVFSTENVAVSSQDPSMGSYMAITTFKAFYEIEGNYDLDGIFNTDVNQKDANDNYVVRYTYIISTVVGVVLLLILISFCFDIAVRSVKIGFLRLIAPVPIMTRIDPKKGNELFSKWVKTCISTYLDLFMRLAAIFFAIYIIKAVTDNVIGGGFVDAVTGEQIDVSMFAIVFIILGALMFAKQLPKLIEDLLGIKLSGSFSLNPVRKLREVPLASAALGGAAGALAGSIGSYRAHRDLGHNPFRALFGGATGAISGLARGGIAGMKDDGKGRFLSGSLDAVKKGTQGIYKKEGTGFLGRNIASIQQSLGLNTMADELDEEIKIHETYAGFQKQLKDIADVSDSTTKDAKQHYEDLRDSGASTAQIEAARNAWKAAQKAFISSNSDPQIAAIKLQAARYVRANRSVLTNHSTRANASYDEIDGGVIDSQRQITIIKAGRRYSRAQANKKYHEKK